MSKSVKVGDDGVCSLQDAIRTSVARTRSRSINEWSHVHSSSKNLRIAYHDVECNIVPGGHPLTLNKNPDISGSLMMGNTLTGTAGSASGGKTPYTYSCQWRIAADSGGPWTDINGPLTPSHGEVTHLIKEAEMGKHYKLQTTITDADGEKVVGTSGPWGPVQAVHAVINPFTTPVDLHAGNWNTYNVYGVVAYNASWMVHYKDATDVWRMMPENTQYKDIINTEYSNLNLATCSWEEQPTSGDKKVILTLGTSPTSAGGISVPFKFTLDDVYQSQSTRVESQLVINFTSL